MTDSALWKGMPLLRTNQDSTMSEHRIAVKHFFSKSEPQFSFFIDKDSFAQECCNIN